MKSLAVFVTVLAAIISAVVGSEGIPGGYKGTGGYSSSSSLTEYIQTVIVSIQSQITSCNTLFSDLSNSCNLGQFSDLLVSSTNSFYQSTTSFVQLSSQITATTIEQDNVYNSFQSGLNGLFNTFGQNFNQIYQVIQSSTQSVTVEVQTAFEKVNQQTLQLSSFLNGKNNFSSDRFSQTVVEVTQSFYEYSSTVETFLLSVDTNDKRVHEGVTALLIGYTAVLQTISIVHVQTTQYVQRFQLDQNTNKILSACSDSLNTAFRSSTELVSRISTHASSGVSRFGQHLPTYKSDVQDIVVKLETHIQTITEISQSSSTSYVQSKPQVGQHGPVKYLPGQYGLGQYGPQKYDLGQHWPAQYGQGQYVPGQYGLGQYGSGIYGLGQNLPSQYGLGQYGSRIHGLGQSLPSQYGLGQYGSGIYGLGQSLPGQYGLGQYGSGIHGLGQSLPGQYGLGQYGSGIYGLGQNLPGRYGLGHYGSGQYLPGRYGLGQLGRTHYSGSEQYVSGQYNSLQYNPGKYQTRPYGPGHYRPGQYRPVQYLSAQNGRGQYLPSQYGPGRSIRRSNINDSFGGFNNVFGNVYGRWNSAFNNFGQQDLKQYVSSARNQLSSFYSVIDQFVRNVYGFSQKDTKGINFDDYFRDGINSIRSSAKDASGSIQYLLNNAKGQPTQSLQDILQSINFASNNVISHCNSFLDDIKRSDKSDVRNLLGGYFSGLNNSFEDYWQSYSKSSAESSAYSQSDKYGSSSGSQAKSESESQTVAGRRPIIY